MLPKTCCRNLHEFTHSHKVFKDTVNQSRRNQCLIQFNKLTVCVFVKAETLGCDSSFFLKKRLIKNFCWFINGTLSQISEFHWRKPLFTGVCFCLLWLFLFLLLFATMMVGKFITSADTFSNSSLDLSQGITRTCC